MFDAKPDKHLSRMCCGRILTSQGAQMGKGKKDLKQNVQVAVQTWWTLPFSKENYDGKIDDGKWWSQTWWQMETMMVFCRCFPSSNPTNVGLLLIGPIFFTKTNGLWDAFMEPRCRACLSVGQKGQGTMHPPRPWLLVFMDGSSYPHA